MLFCLRKKIYKRTATILLLVFGYQTIFPVITFALTTGPSQPEVLGFTPYGTTDLVDLFTGDFQYNIPLFQLPGPNGGYPFNLSYHSGVTADEESSWVGLGWNLNPGAITRQMRGLPDDFNGDEITHTQDIKPNITFGLSQGGNYELFGGDFSKGIPAKLSITSFYNNYKGVGYKLGMGAILSKQTNSGFSSTLGLNISLDSQEGIGIEPSLSLGATIRKNNGGFNGGLSYNSRRGLTDLSLGSDNIIPNAILGIIADNAKLSFANTSYTPQIAMPFRGRSLNFTFKIGAEIKGNHFNGFVGGYYNTQRLENAGKPEKIKSYGYINHENADENSLLDFNREKDGILHKSSPNLAAPVLTYDIFSISGQGVGGMFRAHRSDVGILFDRKVESKTTGGAYGFDLGIGVGDLKLGASADISYSAATSGKWDDENEIKEVLTFTKELDGVSDYEGVYFKIHGESSSVEEDHMKAFGNANPVSVDFDQKLLPHNKKYIASNRLKTKKGTTITLDENHYQKSRKPRSTVVQAFTNKDILDGSSEMLNEYQVDYYNSLSSYQLLKYDRTQEHIKPHHLAGITVLNTKGQRYVYGLPAYNIKQVESLFSVNGEGMECGPTIPITDTDNNGIPDYHVEGTDEFYQKKEIPAYAHSYLLTSVLGDDYVDVDGVLGPSQNDFGYWVKFNYVKVHDDYKWKAPFEGANYNQGYKTTLSDDKASYMNMDLS